MKLKIDPDYKNLLPELTSEEYTNLEKDIVRHGVINPILVWHDTIIDGHNRYAICQAHHIQNFPTKEITFQSKDEAISWILVHQLGRRNLNDFQRNEIALKYQEVIAKRMREKMSVGGIVGMNNRYDKGGSNEHPLEKAEKTTTRKELANIAGTSEGSVQRTKLILEKGTPEQIEKVRNGEVSISKMAKAVCDGAEPKEMRKCRECGKLLPIDEFEYRHGGHRAICEKCRRSIKNEKKRLNGTEGFYVDSVEETVWTVQEVVDQLRRNFKDYIEGLKIELDIHKDEIKSCGSTIDETIDGFVEQLTKVKGAYK